MRSFSARSMSLAALTISFIALISSNLYFASSSSNEISGCVNKKSGDIRITNKCLKTETRLTWNKIGPQGIQGEVGPQGIQGEVGPQGIKGEVGATGPQGTVGPAGASGQNGVTTVLNQSSTITNKVYAANNLLVGNLLGSSPNDVTVQIGNSRVSYSNNGFVILNGEIVYTDAVCSGTKFAKLYLGGTSNWNAYYPFISSIGFDLSRSTAGYFVGETVGNTVETPGSLYRNILNNSNSSECVALSPQDLPDFVGIKALAPLGIDIPISYSTPFRISSN